MPRPCIVCSRSDRQSIDTVIATGASDYAVGRQFNIERVSVGRHRRRHIIKPTQDRLAILAKDAVARQERQELAAAAASDTPSTQALIEATLGLRRQMQKLAGIEERLERMATLAEGAGSSTGVATLAAQQFRGIETGARLAGVGGYATPRIADQPAGGAVKFSITMVFPNAGRTETVTVAVGDTAADGRTIEQELDSPEDPNC